jgi:virginiamycin B lyase
MSARRQLTILLAPLLAFAALSLLLFSIASATAIPAHEAALNPDGAAYEVNRDDRGDLWISDDGAAEIWQVNPPTGAYTVYQGLSHASDARMDAAGSVWWTDASADNKLGRISLGAGKVTTWTLTATGKTWGIGFDEAGNVWTTDFNDGVVFRFTPGSGDKGELCAYPMPDAGTSDYILARDGALWLGDSRNARIVKLDPSVNEFSYWELLPDAVPVGLALAENGDLWWADNSRGELGRLEPGSSRVTTYTLPTGTTPVMIALENGQVWYTNSISGTVSRLDPAVATGTTSLVISDTTPVTPDCPPDPLVGNTTDVSTRTGTLEWSEKPYTQTVGVGLAIYQLPVPAEKPAYPWGVTTSAGQLWVVDQGRQVLAGFSPSTQVYLPLVVKP